MVDSPNGNTAASADLRLPALRRFAVAITLLNLAGHTILGFEQAWSTPFVGLGAAYLTEILLEWVDARQRGRRPRFLAGGTAPIDFLLSAHISGLAVSMLLYAPGRPWAIAFAAVVAIASKSIFRIQVDGRERHFFNPSNLGITATLLLFPWLSIAQPYMFTENLSGWQDWILPVIAVCAGSFLNTKFTRRIVLVGSWLCAFALQAVVRHLAFDAELLAALNPMTGVSFLLFTFYMVSDPATTPSSRRGQVAFGVAVAAGYGFFMVTHVVYGLFFALSLVCCGRGAWLFSRERVGSRAQARERVNTPVLAE